MTALRLISVVARILPAPQKRPADVIGNAVRVMRIATGELNRQLSRRLALII
ncbi:hypothetical protein [Mesorhizobium sp. M4B.F.Ca.ET.019.03.1.1]|uniref:hypothetical protein n=1 Tax=Mesorhizobium sp. M4B.F.Ca.ET.019.03.1.1 TaxID=2496651 RepID=UPI00167C6568|nr:hypothetical protein [Mesorhizobium sp. M4B.F.Ca.ET.019.03.1.1]